MKLPILFGVEGSQPIEWVTHMDRNLYDLRDAGLEWFEKLNEGLEAFGFVQSQVDPCVYYRDDMELLFNLGGCLMCSLSKYKIDDV